LLSSETTTDALYMALRRKGFKEKKEKEKKEKEKKEGRKEGRKEGMRWWRRRRSEGGR